MTLVRFLIIEILDKLLNFLDCHTYISVTNKN